MYEGTDWPWVIAAFALTWIVLGLYARHVLKLRARARDRAAEATAAIGGDRGPAAPAGSTPRSPEWRQRKEFEE